LNLRPWLRSGAVLLATVAVVALAVWTSSPRAPTGPVAAGDFDPRRAGALLHDLVRAPHPPGTAEHERVRYAAEAILRQAGFTVEEQADTTSQVYGRGLPTRVTNQVSIVALRKGANPEEPAVLLAAHYDSVATGPGAADDGYGLVSLLEIARVIGPTDRDLIILLTDGEELGLVGAKAFVARNHLAHHVGVVINIEARGNSGPALLFEIVGPSWSLVEAARDAPHLQGNSLAQSIYQKMPNSTDLSALSALGVPGINIASVGGLAAYHAPRDTAERADLGTLWQAGSTALAAARALAATPPGATLAPDRGQATFFDIAGLAFIAYPSSWAPGVTFLAMVALIAYAVLAARRRKVHGPSVGLALGLQLAAVVIAALFGVGLLLLCRALRPDLMSPAARPLSVNLFLVAHALMALAVSAFTLRFWAGRITSEERLIAGGILWLCLTLLLHRHLAGGAYLFAVPLLLLCVGGILGQLAPRFSSLGLALGALPGLLLLSGTIVLLCQAFVAAASVAVLVLGVMSLAPAAPLLTAATPPRPRLLGLGSLVLGLALVLLAMLLPAYDADAPQPSALIWVWNAERQEASWLSPDPTPPPAWSARHLTAHVPLGDLVPTSAELMVWRGPAAAPAERPVLPRACRRDRDGGADELLLSAPPGTTLLAIDIPASAHLSRVTLNGQDVPLQPSGALAVHLFAPHPQDRLALRFSRGAWPDRLPVQLVAQVPGLPENILASRPPEVANKPSLVLPPGTEIANGDMSLIVNAASPEPCTPP
jgi:hypothetical protein